MHVSMDELRVNSTSATIAIHTHTHTHMSITTPEIHTRAHPHDNTRVCHCHADGGEGTVPSHVPVGFDFKGIQRPLLVQPHNAATSLVEGDVRETNLLGSVSKRRVPGA